jgi:hypothetical protein
MPHPVRRLQPEFKGAGLRVQEPQGCVGKGVEAPQCRALAHLERPPKATLRDLSRRAERLGQWSQRDFTAAVVGFEGSLTVKAREQCRAVIDLGGAIGNVSLTRDAG